RSFTALKVAPEMILNRRFACSPSFTHKLLPAKFRHDTGDFHCCPRGLGAAVDSIFEAALARLIVVVEAEHDVDHWHAVIERNSVKGISHGAAEIFGGVCFPTHDHTASDNRVGFFLSC